MAEQTSLFDGEIEPGTYVEEYGKRLSFDDLTHMIGQIVIIDRSTQSHVWHMAVRVLKIVDTTDGRRLLYSDRPNKGRKDYCSVSEIYFDDKCRRPVKVYYPA